MKFKFFGKFFWKFSMKCHKSFRKNISPQNAYILKITTDLVGKNWPKFGQKNGLSQKFYAMDIKNIGIFLHTEVYLI